MPRANSPQVRVRAEIRRDQNAATRLATALCRSGTRRVPALQERVSALPRQLWRWPAASRTGTSGAQVAASRRIARQGDTWIRLPVPVPAHTDTRRNGNGNAVAS